MHAGHYVLIAQAVVVITSLIVIIKYSSEFQEKHNHNAAGLSNFENSHTITHRKEMGRIKKKTRKLKKMPDVIRGEIKRKSSL